jgi:hypothetical protein
VAKFPVKGTTVKGTIESIVASQQTDIATGQVKSWPDGNPMMQLVVTLSTDERDPEIADDDGQRRLYIKGQMLSAFKEALRLARAKPEVGGTLAVQYKEDGEQKNPAWSPPKLYVAQYKAPAPGVDVGVDELL